MAITTFADEGAATYVGDPVVENQLDQVSLCGSLDLTHDRQGLEDVRRLKTLLVKAGEVIEGEGDRLLDKICAIEM